MKAKNLLFWGLVLMMPVILWFTGGGERVWFGEWYPAATTWAQLAGIAGIGLLAGNILLSGKWRFIDTWFGGLDKAYGLHRSSGKLATYLITLHLALMSLRLWDGSFAPVSQFVLDLTYTPVLYGKLAYLVLVTIVLITLFVKMDYEVKRTIHKWMGVAVLLAGLHIFFIPSDVASNPFLRQYVLSLITLALISYLIKTVIPKRWWLAPNFIVEDVKAAAGNVTEITLNPIMGKRRFVPGQFAFYQFLAPGMTEVHPFTIAASAADPDHMWKIDAKASGDFTKRLPKLPVGTKVLVDGPFGGFLQGVRQNSHSIWVAGGIGITPFLSVLRTWRDSGNWEGVSVDLFYSVKETEVPFLSELQEIALSSNGAVRLIVWNSEDKGRLDAKKIIKPGSRYYICGPGQMIRALRRQLVEAGIRRADINSEEFRLF